MTVPSSGRGALGNTTNRPLVDVRSSQVISKLSSMVSKVLNTSVADIDNHGDDYNSENSLDDREVGTYSARSTTSIAVPRYLPTSTYVPKITDSRAKPPDT